MGKEGQRHRHARPGIRLARCTRRVPLLTSKALRRTSHFVAVGVILLMDAATIPRE
jgi:hypothetical protein